MKEQPENFKQVVSLFVFEFELKMSPKFFHLKHQHAPFKRSACQESLLQKYFHGFS